MRKMLAVSVMLALLTSAVFAEIEVTGQVIGHVDLVSGEKGDKDVYAGGDLDRVRFGLAGESDNGKFGGWARLNFSGFYNGFSGIYASNEEDLAEGKFDGLLDAFGVYGYAWWQPIDQLKLIIGVNPDCFFAKEGIAGWGFFGDANDVAFTFENYSFVEAGGFAYDAGEAEYKIDQAGAFYGGFGEFGLGLAITPIDFIAINLAIPFGINGTAADVYKKIMAQVDLNFNFGNIAITYANEDNLYLYFGMGGDDDSAFSLDVGARIEFKAENYMHPFAIGAAVGVDIGDVFGIQARLQGLFGGKLNSKNKTAPVLEIDILPYIGIGDSVKIYIGFGMDVHFANDKDSYYLSNGVFGPRDKTPLDITFNPYVVIAEHFYAGFKLEATDVANKDGVGVKWSIPIGINFAF